MRVGLLTLSFRLHAVDTLKERRSIVHRILTEVDNLGPAFGVCEVPSGDSLRGLTIRVAHVSTDGGFTDSALRRLVERFEHRGGYEVVESGIEIL
jgi:uncharacterized protein YlxP (DUF503 family)